MKLGLWLFLLEICAIQQIGYSSTIGTRSLYCMTCMSFPGDTTQLDQFRVRQRLNQPSCEMEAVECSVAQDACVTVTMKVGPQRYWVGAGCDQRVNYDYPAHRDGCAKMEVSTRNYQPGWMEEGRANQMVCLCTGNLCNAAQYTSFSINTLLPILIFSITYQLLIR